MKSLVEALEIPCSCIPRIATGFGGGVARHGELCGALSGAVMALGLAHGRDVAEDAPAKQELYRRVGELMNTFAERFENVRCGDLTGCDMLTQEGSDAFARDDLHHRLCVGLVRFAAEEGLRIARE